MGKTHNLFTLVDSYARTRSYSTRERYCAPPCELCCATTHEQCFAATRETTLCWTPWTTFCCILWAMLWCTPWTMLRCTPWTMSCCTSWTILCCSPWTTLFSHVNYVLTALPSHQCLCRNNLWTRSHNYIFHSEHGCSANVFIFLSCSNNGEQCQP